MWIGHSKDLKADVSSIQASIGAKQGNVGCVWFISRKMKLCYWFVHGNEQNKLVEQKASIDRMWLV